MATREEMSRSFGAAADAYDTGRPEYPAEAVEWLLEPVRADARRPRVADVGAGTGKLTRPLVEADAEVVAIDPDAEMLERLRQSVPGVPTFVGTGEALPLPDAGLDAVVFGQAWHWVDPTAASTEAGRVLRPGGVLGLIWNVRDESTAWVAEMSAIMHGSAAEAMLAAGGPTIASPLGEAEERTWSWKRPMTRATLGDMVHSRSYIITAASGERERIDRELEALFDRIGAVDGAVIDLPYQTKAFRSRRP
ncbi:class I SAM-dependent methyltransferase [Microbacterium elymi]|uniref:Class I SAM-dependent methyltransferase n=1 Tax=Microbacterium elymi TaxID=2909587 RepID=A0ABY3SSM4_9MICO|nr:class I SAM-dependent methyltransferase [Microbacterium elymi]UJP12021.2 class I SAM-dependent methyltransferase [Microbacterium elymi]